MVLNQKNQHSRQRIATKSVILFGDDDEEDEDGNQFLLQGDVPCYDLAWNDLSHGSRASAIALGYNQGVWDETENGTAVNAQDLPYKKAWGDLTDGNRQNAMILGYTAKKWNEDHSQSPYAHVPVKGAFCQAMFSWDKEAKKIFRLAVPGFVGSASSAFVTATVSAMISYHMGAANFVAYSMVYVFVGLAEALYGGIPSACSILVAQAIGSGNFVLAGQYEQATFILEWTFGLPLYLGVYFYFPTLIGLFGLEEEVAGKFIVFAFP